jgi:hypothetical protein
MAREPNSKKQKKKKTIKSENYLLGYNVVHFVERLHVPPKRRLTFNYYMALSS